MMDEPSNSETAAHAAVAQDAHASVPAHGHETMTVEHHELPGEAVGYSPFDLTYAEPHVFWLVLTFGLMFIALWKVILPRLASTLEERKDRIAADLDQAARMKAEAEAAERAYETALSDSRAKAHAIATETRTRMDAEVAVEVEAADAEFAKRQQAAEVEIQSAMKKALGHVESIAGEATSDIIAQLTGKAPTATNVAKALKTAQG